MTLFNIRLIIVTGIKKNTRNRLLSIIDKLFLRRRASFVESAFGVMKCNMNLERERHRSVDNYVVNVLSCLVAYSFRYRCSKGVVNMSVLG